jgi:hypothetical protein
VLYSNVTQQRLIKKSVRRQSVIQQRVIQQCYTATCYTGTCYTATCYTATCSTAMWKGLADGNKIQVTLNTGNLYTAEKRSASQGLCSIQLVSGLFLWQLIQPCAVYSEVAQKN